ncbi:hypothetical protein A7U60_g6231 [Sanghuangporus baumii]|uniref:Uncharacterized protein n=1 Tax=Sanghuangporus baumii TaxID=108892 RepID=A0A9Q5HVK8_SANBA|nr:hypothetical protein A7U60_g6231 [Sanghuangporus baumii]
MLLVPKLSSSTSSMPSDDQHRLFRRKGGGGGAAGGHGGGKGGGKGGSSSSKGSSRASDVAKKHGASGAFLNSRSSRPFHIPGIKSQFMAYADGGGKPTVLKSDSAFIGRQAGGGSRSSIYGTSHFGSGYPYGGYGLFVSSRPFPFGFVPVPVSHGYYGGDEYLNMNDTLRPGGHLVTAIIHPSYNSSSATFRLTGDNSSVTTVFDALVANCSVANSSSAITPFSPSVTTWPLPEQVVQYYRASSFALSLDNYNNMATLLANAPVSNDSSLPQIPDTPLPLGLNTTPLQCINTTIGASVPLADVNPGSKFSSAEIAGIVFGSVAGAVLLCCLVSCCCSKMKGEKPSKHEKTKYNRFEIVNTR